jgi:hypothetical protein
VVVVVLPHFYELPVWKTPGRLVSMRCRLA